MRQYINTKIQELYDFLASEGRDGGGGGGAQSGSFPVSLSANAVYGNGCCLFWDPHKTNKRTVSAKCKVHVVELCTHWIPGSRFALKADSLEQACYYNRPSYM
jgi:hypothetical protein